MYLFIPFISGVSCKIYDDLHDNSNLHRYRNDTVTEFLKGIHYITFTTISIQDPLFFIIFYIANILHSITKPAAYSNSYDRSVLYSFLILFFIIDYNKINNLGFYDILICFFICMAFYTEPLVGYFQTEYSWQKLLFRSLLIIIIAIIFCMTHNSLNTQHILIYCIGYMLCSVLIQWYSLQSNINSHKIHTTDDNAEPNISDNTDPTKL